MPRGPAPLSLRDKELRGNPGKHPLNKDEPKAELLKKLPPAPMTLGKYGKREWDRTGPLLVKLKMLRETDLMAFESYCMNVEMMIEAKLDIDKKGLTILGQRGWVRNPSIAAFGQATTAVRAFVGEFGLSPSARTRIKVPTDDDETLEKLIADDGPDNFEEGY